jgi:hypothetical protein
LRLNDADSSSKSVMTQKVEIAVPTEKLMEQTVLDEGTKAVVMTLAEQGWSNNDISTWLLTCEDTRKAMDDLEQGVREYSTFVVSQLDTKRPKLLIMLDSGTFQHELCGAGISGST